MKKIFILSLILTLLISVNVYADYLTEFEEEYKYVDGVIDKYNESYPYYLVWELENTKYVTLTTTKYMVNQDKVTLDNGISSYFSFFNDENAFSIKTFYLNGNEWINCNNATISQGQYFVLHDYGKSITLDNLAYCNFDIKDNSGTVVFIFARYLPTVITGQISSKAMKIQLLNPIKTLIVSLTVLVISALALRKGYRMLKKILLGA